MNSPASADSLIIRVAGSSDIPRLCELLGILFSQEADFTPAPEKQTRALNLILQQPEIGRIYCAIRNAEIVGLVSLLFTISTAEGGRAAWLEDMVIHPEHRASGIGTLLLNAAIQDARADGCHRLTLLTDGDNTSAMRFYQRAGFQRSSMVPFRLKL